MSLPHDGPLELGQVDYAALQREFAQALQHMLSNSPSTQVMEDVEEEEGEDAQEAEEEEDEEDSAARSRGRLSSTRYAKEQEEHE